jgi:Membrane bound beta barrel domain (DUF5777)
VTRSSFRVATALALTLSVAPAARAQDDDAALKLAEQDFTVVALPTALRLPKFGSAFRVTHRFTRSLTEGDFGDVAGDMFGLDTGAQIGLEYRFGVWKNAQVGIHRTSDKDIMLFGQYGLVRQGQLGFDVSLLFSIDGTDNFQDRYSPSLGGIVSRTFGDVFAIYVEPMWVNNSNPVSKELFDLLGVEHNDTFMLGIAGRLRFRPTVYVVGEWVPRSGFSPGSDYGSFAIEKRVGGHTFQLNFSNAYATTRRQLAQGGLSSSDWFLGFNISRKFF